MGMMCPDTKDESDEYYSSLGTRDNGDTNHVNFPEYSPVSEKHHGNVIKLGHSIRHGTLVGT